MATAIWHRTGEAWSLLHPGGFPNESTLHTLVENAPQLLPLAGNPQLTIVGREVLLGANWADLIAVEPNGRLAIIEIKLAKNAEARRAVVAQILAYAAFLHGMDVDTLERQVLAKHLEDRTFPSLAAAASSAIQDGSFDPAAFAAGLALGLAEGRFRLVLVLDHVPDELVRLVGYLDSVADKLLVDLVTVSSYDVNGAEIVVPQRVEPERVTSPPALDSSARPTTASPVLHAGAGEFVASIDAAPVETRPALKRLVDWALSLEQQGLTTLHTVRGTSGRWTLVPRVPYEIVGFVTIWNDKGPALSLWRSVFERLAPNALPRVERAFGSSIGKGTWTRDVSDELLAALSAAYQEVNDKTPL